MMMKDDSSATETSMSELSGYAENNWKTAVYRILLAATPSEASAQDGLGPGRKIISQVRKPCLNVCRFRRWSNRYRSTKFNIGWRDHTFGSGRAPKLAERPTLSLSILVSEDEKQGWKYGSLSWRRRPCQPFYLALHVPYGIGTSAGTVET